MEEQGETKKELTRLRMGGIITKMQMQKFVRQLHDAKKLEGELTYQLDKLQKGYKSLQDSIVEKIEKTVSETREQVTDDMNKKARLDMAEMRHKIEAFYEREMGELK